ncbi:molybdopterin-dependent aldehyde oxidoreductase [Desulfofustis limnaeus]|jgi:aldehyde oxidoreductase|uniref:Aldehyde oxidoreductase n=1 Tax=Desulfofustis limnaeus TaxID=2740163 RepID=A0ABN6M4E2_9BACT|nr:molybdopterin-dependent aldehyde oxidoreductase [Desulfofustis limnaeus]MDX9895787.1 molybdopterin-dependent oxidoreductase [Desulfofustis sp.]BDD86267.1 aldehyde oxidoreductase [Desulfofustis limnaeus]
MIKKEIVVNGVFRRMVVDGEQSLASFIRENLGLTGTKVGCDQGQCGACSVLVDGKVTRSCAMKMKRVADGARITTIEGIGTPDHLHPLQMAWMAHGGAQCGFCTPGFIVSAKGLLDTNGDPTREEVREWFQKNSNACRCTGYKQLVDATMDAAKVLRGEMSADELAYKIPADGRIWGTTYPRPSALAKVTGTCDYGADLGLKLPADTLHLALVQAKVSHATILSIDTSEASLMPGVVKVLTHRDIKGKNRITGLITFPSNKGDGWDRPILCDEKVFQFGDAIAIVCAATQKQARAAAEKVKVEIEELPAYMSAPAAMAEDAIEIHPSTPNIYFEQRIAKGDETAPIFEKAAVVVEDDFYVGRQPHMPIEPDVGFAYVDENGKLVIHSKSIGLNLHLYMIAPGLGVEPEKMVMVQNPAGGTFGYKFSPTMEALVGAAALATGRPVFLGYDYFQQQTYTGKRSPFFINLRLAANKDGTLLGMESDWSVDHGPYSEFGDLLTLRGAQFIGAGYDIPHIRGLGRTVCTNHAWGSAFRAYGSPQSEFASEVLMDELAEKLGMDPLELRYKNVYRPGATTPTGQVPEVMSLPHLLDVLRPKYEAAKAQAKAASTAAVKRGVGISLGVYGSGLDGPDSAEVDAELNGDGTVTVFATWQDHGQGADMGVLATAHEALRPLDLAPEKINLVLNDTSRCPNGGPSGGSRSQVVIGRAIKAACDLLVAGMAKGNGYRSYDEMVADKIPTKYRGTWTAPATACDENGQGSPFACYMYGVFMAEVAVEMATGKTTVEKMTLVADIGKIANKLLVDGQMYGGLAQGIGLALSEDYEDIKKHSTMRGAGFPYIKQIPDDMELHYVEESRPEGPFGASGVGELPLTCPHAAIINGIYHACGVRITQLPALPEKVLAGLNR